MSRGTSFVGEGQAPEAAGIADGVGIAPAAVALSAGCGPQPRSAATAIESENELPEKELPETIRAM
jgi:hypothetical protein